MIIVAPNHYGNSLELYVFQGCHVISPHAQRACRKGHFFKNASSAGSKIGSYFLSSKVFTILGAMSLFS